MVLALALAACCVVPSSPQTDLDRRLEWFRKARIGMFIHWGPVSLRGTEIGWSRGAEVPTEEYDQLYNSFNPTKFDANAWMKLAKDAGMKYVVTTAKHHDGFCLWPTKQTDYSIAHSPFKRDIMGEIAGAARRNGLAMCSYYSILDWHNPLYPTDSPGGKNAKPNPDMPAYMNYMKAQVKELVQNYKLKMLWFDGQWESPYTAEMAKDFKDFLWKLDKNLVINNRVGKGDLGDYDTPEQQVGSFQRGRAWETCMTICQQWAWKPDDKLKSLDEVIRIVVQTVTGDGNLLLNVGPMPNGEIEPRQAERLRELGAWLKKYGDSVYGTRGGPWVNGAWGGSTCRDSVVYLHLLTWKGGDIRLPALPAKVRRARVLTGGEIAFTAGTSTWVLKSVHAVGATDTIVRLDLDRDAVAITPVGS